MLYAAAVQRWPLLWLLVLLPSGSALAADPAAVLRQLPKQVQVSTLLLDLRSGQILSAQRADQPMIPASTMKLVTGAAVLQDRGGAAGWWSSELTVPSSEAGQANVSWLTLRGSGDPTLRIAGSPNSLQALAQQAWQRGIRRVGQLRLNEQGLDAQSFQQGTVLSLPMPAVRLQDWEQNHPKTVREAHQRLGQALAQQLQAVGIELASEQLITSPPQPKDAAASATEHAVASVRSGLVVGFLNDTLRPSDNLRAEALLATLALGAKGQKDLASALSRERQLLLRWGLDPRQITLADGSGLSRQNRLSAGALVQVLKLLYDLPYPLGALSEGQGQAQQLYQQHQNAFIETLPLAGTSQRTRQLAQRGGTLAHRLIGSGLDVRAKTGTLPGVSCLAGYLSTRQGRTLAFAIMMNGPESVSIVQLRHLQDQWLQAVAERY